MDFGARDPVGGVSVAIFMTHAGMTCAESEADVSESMGKILRWCGGLPIALSVTGCAVAYLMRTGWRFQLACDSYVKDFEEEKNGSGRGTRRSRHKLK